jgi:putative transposase
MEDEFRGALGVSEAKHGRALGDENERLKKLLDEVTPDAKQDTVSYATEIGGLSERRACQLVGVSRLVACYEPARLGDAALRVRLRDLAGERRIGHRRLGDLSGNEDITLNHRKPPWIHREEEL